MFVPSLREKYVRLKCSSPKEVVKVRGTLRSLTVSPSSFRSFLAERTAASISLIAAETSSNVPAFTTFKSSSAVYPTLDRPTFSIVLKISSTNLPAVCAIISFTETRLTFVVFFAMSKQILPRKARPRYSYLPLRPPRGAEPPPAGGSGLVISPIIILH